MMGLLVAMVLGASQGVGKPKKEPLKQCQLFPKKKRHLTRLGWLTTFLNQVT